MKIPCDKAKFEAQTVGDKSCVVECEGVRYDCVLQEIIDEKGVEFVKNFIGDKDDGFVSLEWDLAVKRLTAKINNSNWLGEITTSSDGGRYVNIKLPFNAYIASSFKKDEAKKLNEFCKFLEGGR